MVEITVDGPVWTLHLGNGENRFTPDSLTSIDAALDEVERSPGAAALLTVGEGKFFSNGLDLDWLGAHPSERTTYIARVEGLFARLLAFPVPTVAAVNGHAFGAGAMLALAHDLRVMRVERGWFCLPEVDIRLVFSPGMQSLITSTLTPPAARRAMTTGHRYPGPEALSEGIVDATASLADLRSVAADMVRGLAGKDRETLAAIKEQLFAGTLDLLRRER